VWPPVVMNPDDWSSWNPLAAFHPEKDVAACPSDSVICAAWARRAL